MRTRTAPTRLLAAALAAAIQAAFPFPAAGAASAGLSGRVVSIESKGPLAGARVHAKDPASSRVFSSAVTGADGSFSLAGLEAASYRLAVECRGALFVAASPVEVKGGEARAMELAVDPRLAAGAEKGGSKRTAAAFWNDPMTATLVVAGAAALLGVIVSGATDDDVTASPSSAN